VAEEKLKFAVSYGRVIQLKPYETTRFNVLIEHYKDEVPISYAFAEARELIEQQLRELKALEVRVHR